MKVEVFPAAPGSRHADGVIRDSDLGDGRPWWPDVDENVMRPAALIPGPGHLHPRIGYRLPDAGEEEVRRAVKGAHGELVRAPFGISQLTQSLARALFPKVRAKNGADGLESG